MIKLSVCYVGSMEKDVVERECVVCLMLIFGKRWADPRIGCKRGGRG